MKARFLAAGLVCMCALAALPVEAQSDADRRAGSGSPGIPFASVDTPQSPIDVDAIAAEIDDTGRANLVVRLDLSQPFVPEGSLARGAIDRQRAAIAAAGQSLMAALASLDVQVYQQYETIPALALRVDGAGFDALLQSPLVAHIQLDEAVPHTLASSTPVIGAPAVWAQGLDGSGQAVVILDTGIDGSHAFFEDASSNSRIVAEACFSNAGGAGGQVSLCPGGGATQTGSGAAEAAIPACLSGGNQLCNHGSHVAGIAAGNGATFDGVARNADIIAIQVFTRFNAAGDCFPASAPCVLSFNSDQLAALNHVFSVLHPAHTIASVNMSLGGGSNTSHCDADARKPAIDNLRSVGIATVIATGNNGFTNAISTPSCISTAVAVSSTTDADLVSSFSNVHPIMDLFAPGSSINSSVVGGGFATFQGTSMATPHVAGAWAVLKQLSPGASVADVLDVLVDTGVPVTDQRTGGSVTKPRIQLDAAAGELGGNVWQGGINSDWHNAGNWSQGAVPTCASNATIAAGAPNYPVLAADAQVRDLLVENGASLSMAAHTLGVCGNFEVQATGLFAMSGGTLLFDGFGSASLSLPVGSRQLNHLHVGNGTDAKTLALANPLLIAGDLTVDDEATLDSNGQDLTFNGGAQVLAYLGPGGMQTVYENDLSVLTGWTVSNVNGDGFTWVGTSETNPPNNPNTGQHARYRWNTNGTTAANDWLFSPGFVLQAGVEYTIRFDYGARSASFPERLAVHVGNTNSVAAMTTQIFNNGSVANTSWTEGSGTFTPTVSGTYHVGFHAYSLADQWELAVDSLRVEAEGAASLHAIEVVSGASLTLDAVVPLAIEDSLQVSGLLDINGVELTVEGVVANTGTLRDTRDVPNAATTLVLNIANTDGSALRYRGVEITPTSGPMGATTVAIRGQQDCTTVAADPLFRRCFDIEPTTAQTANLRFWLGEGERNGQNSSSALVLHWDGSAWGGASSTASYTRSAAGAACDSVSGNQCWVQANAVTDYSPFVVGAAAGGVPHLDGFYQVRGTVSGLAGSGLVLRNNGTDDLSVSANGVFGFPTLIADGGSYAVTVHQQPTGPVQNCQVVNGGGTISGAHVTDVEVNCAGVTWTVTPSATTGGSIDPSTPQVVNDGATAVFTVTPDTGYSIDTVGGTCGGNLVGNTYTTNAVTGDCTVVASFVINTYTVTPSAGTGGSIDPSTPQTVDHGQTTAFTVIPDTGYSIDTVGGTCGGSLVGNTFTTNAVTANCTVVASFVINTYTVTPSAGTGGSIDPSTPQTVDHGQTIAFTVTPDTGYSIDTVGGTCGGNLVGNTFTTNAVTANCTVVASFVINTYTVTPSAGTGGSIDPSTPQTVDHGQTTAFTVTPDSGFSIDTVGGTCGGSLVGNTYTTNAVTVDCTVVASFVINTYTVTPSAGTGGSIDPSTPQTVDHGQTTAFTVTPDTGYSIDTVGGTCGGNLVGNTFTTNAVTADCTVVASFVINTYTVTPSAGTGGSIDPSTPQTVDYGQTTAFTVTPDTGFSIDTVGGTCGGNLVGNTYTTNAVTADCTVVASFVINTYTVTPSAGTGGSIDPSTPQTVDHGQTTAFTVTPDTGYSIDTVGGTCGGSLAGNTYTTNAVTADCTVVASFVINTYTVTPSAGTGGSIDPSTPQTVDHGQTTAFTVTPDTGHSIDTVGGTCGGNLVGNTFTTNAVTANCTVVASFVINTYTVTPSAGTGGSIDPSTPQTVDHGQTTAFTVTPDSGFSIDTVGGTCGGSLVGNTYTTNAVTADCTVVASFTEEPIDGVCGPAHGGTFTSAPETDLCEAGTPSAVSGDGPWTWTCQGIAGGSDAQCSAGIQTWTVTPSAGAGGSIDPSTAQTVNHGQSAVFTVTPDSGFSIDAVGGTCGGGLAGDTYTTDAVTADCTVEASFVAQVLDAAIRKRVTHSLVLLDDADLVRFRILVENVGPEDIVGAEVLDLMPVEMTGVSWTCEEIAGGECANVSGVGDIQELVNLPVGGAVAFIVAGRIDNLPAGGLANVAVVDVDGDEAPEDNTSGALYQRCTASNLQTDPEDETLLEHACVFLDGYEE